VNNDDRQKGTENNSGANPNEDVNSESRENSDDDTGANLDQELRNDREDCYDSDANSNEEMKYDCNELSDEGTGVQLSYLAGIKLKFISNSNHFKFVADEVVEIIDDSIAYGKKKLPSRKYSLLFSD